MLNMMIRRCAFSIWNNVSSYNRNQSTISSITKTWQKLNVSNMFLTTCPIRMTSTSTIMRNVTGNNDNNNKQLIEDFLNIKIEIKNNETHVEAIPVPTGREDLVVKTDNNKACALCRLNIRNLHYTDVMILSQWIKKNGSLATYEESKLCTKQYKKVKSLIQKAQRCNLIKRPADYFVPGAWHDLNTYLEPDRARDQPIKVVKKEYWKM